MSKKPDKATPIITAAIERHFKMLIDQAILWLGAEAVIAHAEMAKRKEAA